MTDKFSYENENDLELISTDDVELEEIVQELKYDNITIVNPKTGNTIKVSTALTYPPEHPAYKLAHKTIKNVQSSTDSAVKSVNKTLDTMLQKTLSKINTPIKSKSVSRWSSKPKDTDEPEIKRIMSKLQNPKRFQSMSALGKQSIMKKLQGKLARSIGEPHKDALLTYAGNGFLYINSFLRKEKKQIAGHYSSKIKEIDEVFKRDESVLDIPIVVSRGIQNPNLVKNLIKNRNGIFVDRGFMSTSLKPGVAEDFSDDYFGAKLTIHVPKGKRAISMDALDTGLSGEYEVLLPRNTKLKIVDFKRKKTRSGEESFFEVVATVV